MLALGRKPRLQLDGCGAYLRGQVVRNAGDQRLAGIILQQQLDLCWTGKCCRMSPIPAHAESAGLRQTPPVEEPKQQKACIPGENRITKPGFEKCGSQKHQADDEKDEEAPSEGDSTRQGSEVSFHRRGRQGESLAHLGTSTAAMTSATTWSGVTPSRSASGRSMMR